jgi:hypothetical protein
MFGFWVIAILVLLLILLIPAWPYSARWGYTPAGLALALIVVWGVLIWMGWIAVTWPWASF